MLQYVIFSSFKLCLRWFKMDENTEEIQSKDAFCLSMDEIVSTEPCLADQLREEAKFKSSSSSSISWSSSIYYDKFKENNMSITKEIK